jgi:cobalamin biosynthesis protein CobT
MNDDTMDEFVPEESLEFHVCLVCGETNCEDHKDHPINGGGPAPIPYSPMIKLSAEEWAMALGAPSGVVDTLKANKDDDLTIHTDEKTEHKKVEDDDGEEEKWEDLPPVKIHGGIVRFKETVDTDKSGGQDWDRYDLVKQDMITSALDGMPHSFRLYRAKKESDPARFKTLYDKALTLVPKLKQRLMLALEAEARTARERGLKRGSVDAGRASQLVAAAKDDIFSKKANRREIKTAVSIVLDDSTSMNEIQGMGSMMTAGAKSYSGDQVLNSKFGCCAVLALALGDALQALGIPFEIVSYERRMFDGNQMKWANHFSIQYKSFNEPWSAVKTRIGNYNPCSGDSLTYEAAAYAAKRLMTRTEDRKILFHLTDAMETNRGMSQIGQLASDMGRKAGIRYVGVGILNDDIKKFLGPKSEVVMKLEDLNDAVFTRLAKLIHPTS